MHDGPASDDGALLVLEDGTELAGRAFGARGAVAGEVVFNTGMTGYVETLTDPSYKGQILVATYPLVGSYGVPAPRKEGSIDAPFESDRVQVQGLVVQTYVGAHSHHAATRSLGQWLEVEGVPAITGVDTRTLTRKLREHGTMRGWIVSANGDVEQQKRDARVVEMKDEVFRAVAPAEPALLKAAKREPGRRELTVLLVDVGAKDNIARSLLARGADVLRAPWHAPLQKLAKDCDGVMIGNGPGDPKDLVALVEEIRALLAWFTKPVFGICLGNQILALAAGGDTYKLPYGHRGVNQPVIDLLTRRCYVTSQNHGYAVKDGSLPPEWEPWFVNLNDGTNEGVRSRTRPFFSVQFHPEASPGPEDAAFLFDDFLRLVGAMAR
ncbi:MAG TPA: glutamine-hydrolyzing carbamoyl-phosphate synthase small subunit [Byssovorax sp.]|jgi:carbamoyl-phosphate synthase small subunit